MKTRYFFIPLLLLLFGHVALHAQSESEVKSDGIIFPRLAVYPASPDFGQVIYYTTNGRFEFYNGTSWQALSTGSGGATDKIEDGIDNDSYVEVLENGLADYIKIQAEGDHVGSFYSNQSGVGRLELFGFQNVSVGDQAGEAHTPSSIHNTNVGNFAGSANNSGDFNVNIGSTTGQLNGSGSDNTMVGTAAGYENTGSDNVFLGRNAGRTNTGSGNVFLGNETGMNATGNNKLMIDNSNTVTPLIYGDFTGDRVFINRTAPITGAEFFGVTGSAPTAGQFAGMYMNASGNAAARPFIGMSINEIIQSYLYHDGVSDEMRFYNNGERFSISNTGVVEINSQYKLPTIDGAADQVLTTNGFGQASWTTISSGSTNLIEDADSDTKVTAREAGTADYIEFEVEGSTGDLQIRKNPSGDLRIEFTGSTDNVNIGNNAGDAQTNTALRNVAIGDASGSGVTTGDDNTFVGNFSGYQTSTSSQNTYLGSLAGYTNSTGIGNTAVGYAAGRFGINNFNTIVGSEAFENMDNFSEHNVVMGYQAAEQADQASYSVMLGYQAGQLINDGYNVLIGYQAGQNQNNTNQVMKNNVIIGFQAGQENDGNRNVYIGKQAGTNNQGDGNVFIGNNAGGLPTAVDDQLRITTQNTNVRAPLIYGEFDEQIVGINTTSVDGNFHVKQTGSLPGIVIENNSDSDTWSFEIGANDLVVQFNGSQVGTFDDASGNYTPGSDRRLKESIESLPNGTLTRVLSLEPSTYYFKRDSERNSRSIGLIAQDVQKLFPEVVRVINEDEQILGVGYSELTVVAIQAIKEQQEIIDSLEERLDQQEHQIQMLIDKLK